MSLQIRNGDPELNIITIHELLPHSHLPLTETLQWMVQVLLNPFSADSGLSSQGTLMLYHSDTVLLQLAL